MIQWKIYYGNGRTYSSAEGTPGEAPGRNVQLIADADPDTGYTLLSGRDYYIRRDGQWIGVDLTGLIDQLVDLGIIKQGRMLSNREFAVISNAAHKDPDLPRKSAYRPDERHIP